MQFLAAKSLWKKFYNWPASEMIKSIGGVAKVLPVTDLAPLGLQSVVERMITDRG